MCEKHTENLKSDNTWSVNVRNFPHITPSDGAGIGLQFTTSVRLQHQFELLDRRQQRGSQALDFGHLLQHGRFCGQRGALQVAPGVIEVRHVR